MRILDPSVVSRDSDSAPRLSAPHIAVDSVNSDSQQAATASASQMVLPLPYDRLASSTTSTQVDPDAIVGGSDTQYPRRQLRLNNTFHDIG